MSSRQAASPLISKLAAGAAGCRSRRDHPVAVLVRVHAPMPGICRAIAVPPGAGARYWCGKPQMNVRSTKGRVLVGREVVSGWPGRLLDLPEMHPPIGELAGEVEPHRDLARLSRPSLGLPGQR